MILDFSLLLPIALPDFYSWRCISNLGLSSPLDVEKFSLQFIHLLLYSSNVD